MSIQPDSRRQFIKSAFTLGAGVMIVPSGVLRGATKPSDKLNIALIGAWGRATKHYRVLQEENVTAICDVSEKNLAVAAKEFPKAKKYVDWRKCLEQKDLDAVVCCTTDFTHAFVSIWAMNRGLHVYGEKPLANSVEEARMVRETYLKNKKKIATQCGTQRHAHPNFPRIRELIRDGAIGALKDVHVWGNRKLPKPGYLPAKGKPPDFFHWDLWLGPALEHPYNPGYFNDHGGKPGTNCLNWNMYWDFGSGQLGDMGSHTIDLAWNAIDAELPVAVKASGEEFNPDVTPVRMKATWNHPKNGWRSAITLTWYQGGEMPNSPRKYVDLDKISHGAMFKGDKGFVVADFKTRILIPHGKETDLTYYERRDKSRLIPGSDHHQREWTTACKGNLKTSCDFDYSGNLIEQNLLAHVAYRVGKKLQYDGKKMKVTNSSKANELLKKKYRKGWVLNG